MPSVVVDTTHFIRRNTSKDQGTPMHANNHPRPAFSSIELIIILVLLTMMAAVLLQALTSMRSHIRGLSSEAKLATIGQISAMYAQDNDDRIYSFTLRQGDIHTNIANGIQTVITNDTHGAQIQVRDILQRHTGRLNGKGKIISPAGRLMHRRYSHLVLADYLGGNIADPMWADPADTNLLRWQADLPVGIDEYQDSGIPYAFGEPEEPGYDDANGWATNGIRQLWPFASSYQLIPHAWLNDFGPQYVPHEGSPHTFLGGGSIQLGERRYHQVRFPSMKVHMFEEFDREQKGSPYFAYDHAAPAKLMFDGSINTLQSGFAHSSVNYANLLNGDKIVWDQHYVPIDTFPHPLGGLTDQTQLNQRYRWTLGGLQGIDYPQTLTRSNNSR